MKIYRVSPGNFGDDLNEVLIKEYIGNVFKGNVYLNIQDSYPDVNESDTLIVAIGTILNQRAPKKGNKVVLGAGTGYGVIPNLDKSWSVEFVRGPLTAKKLGLGRDKYITDPAILLADRHKGSRKVEYKYGYIPHHGCANETWKSLCESLNILYIDIRRDYYSVMNDIASCEVILTEAMHGAIVSDSLRIPWIPINTASKINEFKWHDWCQSMGIEYKPHRLFSLWKEKGSANKLIFPNLKKQANEYKLKKIMNTSIPIMSKSMVFRENLTRVQEAYSNYFSNKEI